MLNFRFRPKRGWEMSASYSKTYFTDTSMATLLAYRPDVECLEALKIEDGELLVKYGHTPPPVSWYSTPSEICSCAGITMGEDQHRIYGLFFSKSTHKPDLYRMWFKQFETAKGEIEYTGIDVPILALTGIDYDTPTTKMSQYVLSDIYPYLMAEGISGWSWSIPNKEISKYSLIFSRYGYIFVVFPIWYRMYPAYYQAILMFRESNGDVVGAGVMGSASFWTEGEWHSEPLVDNVVDLDGYFIFRQVKESTFPIRWSADEFFRRWSHPRTIHPGPGNTEELRSPMNAGVIGIRDLINQLLGSDINHPAHIKLQQHNIASPVVSEDYESITVSHSGRRLYGVKYNYIQEYEIGYARFFQVHHDGGADIEVSEPYGKYLINGANSRQYRVTNTSTNTTIYNMRLEFTDSNGVRQDSTSIGGLSPNQTKVITVNLKPTSGSSWKVDTVYSIMV